MALADSLIAYWSLDEASGNALDAHGSNHLTETSGTIASTTGKVGNCRDFEQGDTEYFVIADNTDLSTGDIDFSIAFWIFAETLVNFPLVLAKSSGAGGANTEYQIYANTGGNSEITFGVASATANANYTEVKTSHAVTPISTATWYFIVVWHDPAANQIGINLNAGTPVTASYSAGVYDGTGDFHLGGNPNHPLYWDGLIDEVGFWKRVLSGAEHTELYNSGNGRDYSYIVPAGGQPTIKRMGGVQFGVGPFQLVTGVRGW